MSKDYGKARFATGGSKFDELSPDDKKKAIEAMKLGEEASKKNLEALYSSTEKPNGATE